MMILKTVKLTAPRIAVVGCGDPRRNLLRNFHAGRPLGSLRFFEKERKPKDSVSICVRKRRG